MRPPEQDIAARQPVWDQLQMLFMDSEPDLDAIAAACAASPYSVPDLEEVLFLEVLPACGANVGDPCAEWRGFALGWLTRRILESHRFGRGRPWRLRRYTTSWWRRLRPKIEARRAVAR